MAPTHVPSPSSPGLPLQTAAPVPNSCCTSPVGYCLNPPHPRVPSHIERVSLPLNFLLRSDILPPGNPPDKHHPLLIQRPSGSIGCPLSLYRVPSQSSHW